MDYLIVVSSLPCFYFMLFTKFLNDCACALSYTALHQVLIGEYVALLHWRMSPNIHSPLLHENRVGIAANCI